MKPRTRATRASIALSAALAAASLVAVTSASVQAQSSSEKSETTSDLNSRPAPDGIPIEKIIVAVAHKDGRKYIVDPRVRAYVQLIGQDVSNINAAQLQTILSVHGFIAVEEGGYVLVLPDANARQTAIPTLNGKESYPDSQVVTAVFHPKTVSASYLVPILRPMVPQYGHLAALPSTNPLIMVDRFANVKRMEAIIHDIDVGEPFKPEKC